MRTGTFRTIICSASVIDGVEYPITSVAYYSATVQAIREQMDVSTESWQDAVARLNLSLEAGE